MTFSGRHFITFNKIVQIDGRKAKKHLSAAKCQRTCHLIPISLEVVRDTHTGTWFTGNASLSYGTGGQDLNTNHLGQIFLKD